MHKERFMELAQAAAHTGLDDLDYTARQKIMCRQLGLTSSYDLPSSDEFTPTAFYTAYNTGGWSGGSCWGDEARPYREDTSKDANKFDSLDAFLDEHFSDLKLSSMRAIERAVEQFSFTEYEYYGNSSDYAVRMLSFDALYDVLNAAGMVD